jgi:hypothetical protein
MVLFCLRENGSKLKVESCLVSSFSIPWRIGQCMHAVLYTVYYIGTKTSKNEFEQDRSPVGGCQPYIHMERNSAAKKSFFCYCFQ